MSDIYAQILEELPEGKRPRFEIRGRVYELRVMRTNKVCEVLWIDIENGNSTCARDENPTIRCAAEDFVREWCKIHGVHWIWDETPTGDPGKDVHLATCDDNGKCQDILGCGPDLPTALLAAVRYCKAHT